MRSALYVPCDHVRALAKTATLPADAFIFDLEDGVAPAAKAAARDHIGSLTLPNAYCMLRVNHRSTAAYTEDMALFSHLPVHAVMLSKVHDVSDIDDACALLIQHDRSELAIWANIETPHGVAQAEAICAHPRIAGVVVGTNDLANDLRVRITPDRLALRYSLQRVQLAARAFGKTVLDGTFVTLNDSEGFKAECEQGRQLGFDGKTLIHPSQIELANAIFGPTADDKAWAKEVIRLYDVAQVEDKAVTLMDGQMIEALHYRRAKEILAQ
tara:strand:+ start:2362 stop:3171 length:810 start_codon:yes stop_codon:yes gene_type:complete